MEPVLEALKTVQDPEIPVNLVDLGLIYELIVKKGGIVFVEMTLTTPACPVAQSMPGEVEAALLELSSAGLARAIRAGKVTCLAAMQATGYAAWAALSTSGLRALELPDDIRDVIVLADGDPIEVQKPLLAALRAFLEG